MATWFSNPITWNPSMTLDTDPENRMKVSVAAGPINITALYDGMLVYRPSSASPDTGNLELVLMPDKWTEDMKKFFNPQHPQLAHSATLTELPPGRVVYLDLAKSVIKQSLHKLILDAFMVYVGDQTKVHRSLNFIPDVSPTQLLTLKAILLDLWRKTPIDQRQKKVDAEIDRVIDLVLNLSLGDPVMLGLPIQVNDVLCPIGDSRAAATVTFEIRNLYGEPLNPHFYLNSIGGSHANLTPTPPFQVKVPAPRFRATDRPLFIRIPKTGGAEFELAKHGDYKSPLVWTHEFDASTGRHTTKVDVRPGESATAPKIDANAQTRVNQIWDTDFAPINKHADIFGVPCELILSTIYNESHFTPSLPTDLHSVHTEPIEATAPFPTDYKDLMDQTKVAGSLLTKKTVDAYFGAVGGFALDPRGMAYAPRIKSVAATDLPKLKPPFPLVDTAKIGASENLRDISWKQLDEIIRLKPQLIATDPLTLPALGKTGTDYHYTLIAGDSNLGPNIAETYWKTVGGVKKDGTTEKINPLPATPFGPYPLPTNKDWQALVDPDDATKVISWGKLLAVLDLLKQKKVKNVPQPTYTLVPLGSVNDWSYSTLLARPELIRLLGVTAAEADDIMQRYFALMTKGIVYADEVGPGKVPGVRRDVTSPPTNEYLTLRELRAVSQIYPDRISIGVGQITFETASRFVLPWIKTHFGAAFFTDQINVDPPPDGFKERIPWMWDNFWENEELQIALIAAYHKQNATTFWESFKEKDGSGGNTYRCGDLMTRFDFPRVGSAYNAGYARKAFQPASENADSNWGLHTSGNYFVRMWSAVNFAVARFATFPPGDAKEAHVRLRPDIEVNAGMDPR